MEKLRFLINKKNASVVLGEKRHEFGQLFQKKLDYDQIAGIIDSFNLIVKKVSGKDFAFKGIAGETKTIKKEQPSIKPLLEEINIGPGFWFVDTQALIYVFEANKRVVLGGHVEGIKNIESEAVKSSNFTQTGDFNKYANEIKTAFNEVEFKVAVKDLVFPILEKEIFMMFYGLSEFFLRDMLGIPEDDNTLYYIITENENRQNNVYITSYALNQVMRYFNEAKEDLMKRLNSALYPNGKIKIENMKRFYELFYNINKIFPQKDITYALPALGENIIHYINGVISLQDLISKFNTIKPEEISSIKEVIEKLLKHE